MNQMELLNEGALPDNVHIGQIAENECTLITSSRVGFPRDASDDVVFEQLNSTVGRLWQRVAAVADAL